MISFFKGYLGMTKRISSEEHLARLYSPPTGRSVRKVLNYVDRHGARFIALSPFCFLATNGRDGHLDISPRGGVPGFVTLSDAKTLLLPDWPGNNRLDSFRNLLDRPHAGLLFMIPGVSEVYRLRGVADLSIDENLRAKVRHGEKEPKLVLRFVVHEAFLHCAKAIMRAALWQSESQIDRRSLPTMGEMLKEQTNDPSPAETESAMIERYQKQLYKTD
jgi:PPOX class probable FMN-dependent enzyme